MTNTGETQHVSEQHVIDISGIGDDGFAGSMVVEVGPSRAELLSIMVTAGDRASFVGIFAVELPGDDQLRALTEAVVRRLED